MDIKRVFFILLAVGTLAGCSKDGSGNRLMNGGEMVLPPPAAPDPLPTDTNLPDLDETP